LHDAARLGSAAVTGSLESTRQAWEDGYRRFREEIRDSGRDDLLERQLAVVTEELRRRVGQTFTLHELADAHAGAERWVREAVELRAAAPGWPRTLALVEDAAFFLYQRGAVDYRP
jgi:hypothetical protein